MRLLFASRDLSFGKHLGVLSPRIKAKLERFPRSDPGAGADPVGPVEKRWSGAPSSMT